MSRHIIGVTMLISCTSGLGVREVMIGIGLWSIYIGMVVAIRRNDRGLI